MRIALAGDTMLGRGVAERLRESENERLFDTGVVELTRGADLFVLNLECCISARGEPWRAHGKPFFFRAPPVAVDVLADLGTDCVTLANNHALDFGYDALADTLRYLDSAKIAHTGAGIDLTSARRPAELDADGLRIEVIGVTDHPSDFAARENRPGVALADLRRGVPSWLTDAVAASEADVVVASPHWGPNMTPEPLGYVRSAGEELVGSGATVVAGHSAHVFHGAAPPILFDLGDFIDDYAVDPVLRNDLGLLWLLDLDATRITTIEAVPIKLDYCHTHLARGEDREWVSARLASACAALGTELSEVGERLVIAG